MATRSRITKRNLHIYPQKVQEQVREALELASRKKTVRGPRLPKATRVKYLAPPMETKCEPLEIWLPGLELYSSNVVLRGYFEIVRGKKKRVRPIQVQSRAKAEAASAYIRAIDNGAKVHRFDCQVDITVHQYHPRPHIDGPNLWEKSIIDCLSRKVNRTGLLGIIHDDADAYVRDRTTGNRKGELGVLVIIRPVKEN